MYGGHVHVQASRTFRGNRQAICNGSFGYPCARSQASASSCTSAAPRRPAAHGPHPAAMTEIGQGRAMSVFPDIACRAKAVSIVDALGIVVDGTATAAVGIVTPCGAFGAEWSIRRIPDPKTPVNASQINTGTQTLPW